MTLDPSFYAVAVPAVVFMGVSKAGFGGGADFAAVIVLALLVGPIEALALSLPLLILIDAMTLGPYWRQWDPTAARLLIVAGTLGALAGGAVYRIADPDLFRLLIGAIALGFVAFQLGRARGRIAPGRPLPPAGGALFGFAAGFASFVSHAGGPPAVIYLLSQRLSKTGLQASMVATFATINAVKAVLYGLLGIFTPETLTASLTLAPAALAGTWLGVKAHRRVPERAFFAVTYVLLALTGLRLLWDGLG
jgi:uncharacterized membrane protein YfcA